MMFVRGYKGTGNLGDAMQTLALRRLLPDAAVWFGKDSPSGLFVVNGWLGREPYWTTTRAVFAGVFLSPHAPRHADWAATCDHLPIGARDPFTYETLARKGVPVELIGCATMTLPRFTGPRSGELHFDDDTPCCMVNSIPFDMPWEDQLILAECRLDQLKRAAVVYTKRLHIALPCLAFGTPVKWSKSGDYAQERFSLLDAIGDDLSAWADRYEKFLARRLANARPVCAASAPPCVP
jgi:hypothetical protein